jgi:hypothetical protein
MPDPAEQPTINEILKDFGLHDILDPDDYADLLAALESRDNIMRTDAAEYTAKKALMAALDKIIKEV